MKKHQKPDNQRLPNYFALVAIVPAILSIIAYDFIEYFRMVVWDHGTWHRTFLYGLGMLTPMALMVELFTFFLSSILSKRINKIAEAMQKVAQGDFSIEVKPEKLKPFRDIAIDFNKMTNELRSVETLRKDFINDFSHEFKTPISSINGFAKLLLETDVSEEDRRAYLEIIAEESERLAALAGNTMLLSKLENQTILSEAEDYRLDKQIRQNIILLSNAWEEKKIQMDVDLEEITYHGNADLMSHVWMNLLSNAIKFTPKHGIITVSMEKKEDEIKICFADTGIGMSEEDRKRIFQKYYQADASHATKGMGLGLSIVYRIIEMCEGTITVESTPGEGSSFTITLPAYNSIL